MEQNRKSSTDISQRKKDWEESAISELRQELHGRIESLSETWKKERTAREEQRKKDLAEGKEIEKTDTSDSDIDIADVVPPPIKSPVAKGKRAIRIRG